jgi:[CysO sulfur-carrier protein]-S-L-cysteine hydrolase
MPFRLTLPRDIHDAILAQALAEQPNECCGLLAGVVSDGVARVVERLPLVNELASERRYHADAMSLFAAHRRMREAGLVEVAVYHSHPTSPAVPSRTDLEQWFYGEAAVCFIVTLTTSPPTLRGWWLTATDYREAEWEVEES